ncbi:MAG TPA: SDR family NAD(P)-dependent oxidoreductase [Bacillota bacterium]|nr:SDR family NAD(P)-dependent oxidoreductase [Bacillota bacterium]
MDLKGRVAWVTGGISGIGAATSKALYEAGCKLILTDINDELGHEFVKQFGDDAVYIHADQKFPEELEAAAAQGVEKFGRLDILFNSAGKSQYVGALLSDDPEIIQLSNSLWEEGIKEILGGSYHAARVAVSHIKKNEPDENGERGCIIFVASMSADKVFIYYDQEMIETFMMNYYPFAYGAAKTGILGLTAIWPLRWPPTGFGLIPLSPAISLPP